MTTTERQRRPSFDDATVALFKRFDAMRGRSRGSEEFKRGVRELARRLNLVPEFWTGNSVLDRAGTCHPEGYIANDDWRRCRDVRLALLDAMVRKTP